MTITPLLVAGIAAPFHPYSIAHERLGLVPQSRLLAVPVIGSKPAVELVPTMASQAEQLGMAVVSRTSFEAVQREDRPLLMGHRAQKYEAMHWPCMAVVKEMSENLDPATMRSFVGGDVAVDVNTLTEASRSTILNAFGNGFPGYSTGQFPTGAKIRASAKYHLRFVEKGGAEHILVLNDQSSVAPFNPDRYRSLFVSEPGIVMPKELKVSLGTLRFNRLKTTYKLSELVNSVHAPGLTLALDRRASDWSVALSGPKDNAEADTLEAVAYAHRLYWHRVGKTWFLATAPYNPRLFAIDLERARARKQLFEALAPLARMGALREDLFVNIASEEGQPFGQWDSKRQSFVQALLDGGTPITDKAALGTFLQSRSRVSDCRVQVTLDTSMSVRWEGNSLTIGVSNP